MVWPVEMPPVIPPPLLVAKSPSTIVSLDSLPFRPDFDAFDGADGHDGGGEAGVELGEDGVAEARGYAEDVELDDAADGVRVFPGVEDALFHFLGGFGVGAADGVGFDGVVVAGFGFDAADFDGMGVNFNAALLQDFHCDGPCGDAGGCFASGGASAAAVVSVCVFLVEGEIGVSGAEEVADFFVFGGVLVLVVNDEADGGAGCFAFEDAGEDFDGVGFFALGDDFALAGFAAVHFFLDDGVGHFEAGADAFEDAADGFAVGFAETGHADDVAEGVGGPAADGEFAFDGGGCLFGEFFGGAGGCIDDGVGEGGDHFRPEGELLIECVLSVGSFQPRREAGFGGALPEGVRVGGEHEDEGVLA